MFEFIVRLYKYIQQIPAGVSSVPISEPSAQCLVNPPLAAVTALSLWWRLTDGTSGRSVKVLGDQGILDWVGIWALARPLQNIQLVVFDLFLCVWGRRLWWVAVFFFSFCAAIVFCTGNTGEPKWTFRRQVLLFYIELHSGDLCFTDINEPDLCWISSVNIQAKNSHCKVAWICLQSKCRSFLSKFFFLILLSMTSCIKARPEDHIQEEAG